ncbi:DUF5053 domain-containing protein [Parabacteroides johnsonii]|uniref:DUF5053 domain-containing protein n=1 Tax=Parabacteroides johnsonii TaxID=387661 RepID=UPI0011DD12B2|nr:DUF5053 domain-containing protein [Parabacteroides johnsonii]
MDVKLELKRWKADFALVSTKEQKAEYDKRFKAFLASLSSVEKKEFAQAYREGAREAIDEAKKISKIIDRKQKLDNILGFASMSYIAEHYFGKSRQWLYQRINGNMVNGKPADFTPDELKVFSVALSELGEQLKRASVAIL